MKAISPLCCAALAGLGVLGQTPYGRITGRVVDTTGAVVVGAAIRVLQTETNIATTTASSNEGVYDLSNLLPGQYRVLVEMQEFRRHERGPIEVRVGDVLGVDIALEVGSLAETVTVQAEAPQLESTTASLGQTIDNKKLSDLPLGGRGLSYLMQLTPGIISINAPTHGWLPQARGSVSDIATLGTRTRSSEFTLDGCRTWSRTAPSPSSRLRRWCRSSGCRRRPLTPPSATSPALTSTW